MKTVKIIVAKAQLKKKDQRFAVLILFQIYQALVLFI